MQIVGNDIRETPNRPWIFMIHRVINAAEIIIRSVVDELIVFIPRAWGSIPHARCFLPSYHLSSPFAMKMDEKTKDSVTEAPVTKQVENGQISIPAEEIFVDPAVERAYRK